MANYFPGGHAFQLVPICPDDQCDESRQGSFTSGAQQIEPYRSMSMGSDSRRLAGKTDEMQVTTLPPPTEDTLAVLQQMEEEIMDLRLKKRKAEALLREAEEKTELLSVSMKEKEKKYREKEQGLNARLEEKEAEVRELRSRVAHQVTEIEELQDEISLRDHRIGEALALQQASAQELCEQRELNQELRSREAILVRLSEEMNEAVAKWKEDMLERLAESEQNTTEAQEKAERFAEQVRQRDQALHDLEALLWEQNADGALQNAMQALSDERTRTAESEWKVALQQKQILLLREALLRSELQGVAAAEHLEMVWEFASSFRTELDAVLRRLQDTENTCVMALERLRLELQKEQEAHQKALDKHHALEAEFGRLKATSQNVTSNHSGLGKRLEAMKDMLQDCQQANNALHGQLTELQWENTQLGMEKEDLHQSLRQAKDKCKLKKQEMKAKCQRQLQKMKEKMVIREKELGAEVLRLQAELRTLVSTLQDLAAEKGVDPPHFSIQMDSGMQGDRNDADVWMQVTSVGYGLEHDSNSKSLGNALVHIDNSSSSNDAGRASPCKSQRGDQLLDEVPPTLDKGGRKGSQVEGYLHMMQREATGAACEKPQSPCSSDTSRKTLKSAQLQHQNCRYPHNAAEPPYCGDPRRMDPLLSSTLHGPLTADISEALGVEHLAVSNDPPQVPVNGALFGPYHRPIVSLLVGKDESSVMRHVFFTIDTGCPFTYLTSTTLQALGFDGVVPQMATLNVHGSLQPISRRPKCKYFPNSCILGADFFVSNRLQLLVDYVAKIAVILEANKPPDQISPKSV